MAVQTQIGGDGNLFVGEDKTIRLGPLYLAEDPTIGVDMAGWVMVFDVRLKDTSPDPPIISISPLPVTGTFNGIQANNQQYASAVLTDTQMNLFKAKTYRWSWKRLDDGNETVLGWGNFSPQKATAP